MAEYTHNMQGKNIKLVDNQDGTYSVSARPEYVPVTVKVPVDVDYQKFNKSGYPLFVDEEDNVYFKRNNLLFKTNDGIAETQILDIYDFVDSEKINTIEWYYKSKETGRHIISVFKTPFSNGQIWSADDINGTWTKVLDVSEIEGLGDCKFRYNASWQYFDGLQDIIIAGTYNQLSHETQQCADVYLSTDEGKTFKRIFRADTYKENANRHIHAVSYSPWDGWIWVTHGDDINRGISYSVDMGDTWIAVSEGSHFLKGGWQPTGVVPLLNTTAFASDNSISNGILTWYRPDTTNEKDIKKIDYAWQKLHHDGTIAIGRRGAQISSQEAYLSLVHSQLSTTIMVTGDGGFSWHAAKTLSKELPFEEGFTNADSEGYVWGSGMSKFKITKWDNVTKWVKGRHIVNPYQD